MWLYSVSQLLFYNPELKIFITWLFGDANMTSGSELAFHLDIHRYLDLQLQQSSTQIGLPLDCFRADLDPSHFLQMPTAIFFFQLTVMRINVIKCWYIANAILHHDDIHICVYVYVYMCMCICMYYIYIYIYIYIIHIHIHTSKRFLNS